MQDVIPSCIPHYLDSSYEHGSTNKEEPYRASTTDKEAKYPNMWPDNDNNLFDCNDMNYLISLANEGANNIYRAVARCEANLTSASMTVESLQRDKDFV